MATTDPRVDQYIQRAAPFAQPVLTHLRGVLHSGCPALHETINSGTPKRHLRYRARPSLPRTNPQRSYRRTSPPPSQGMTLRAGPSTHSHRANGTSTSTGSPKPSGEETRAQRLAQAIEWLAEGKPRRWKYQGC